MADLSPKRKRRLDTPSPPRNRRSKTSERHRFEKDLSPSRRRQKGDDLSPVRRRRNENSPFIQRRIEKDLSPVRKRRDPNSSISQKHLKDDISPVRRKDCKEDLSPPRKRKPDNSPKAEKEHKKASDKPTSKKPSRWTDIETNANSSKNSIQCESASVTKDISKENSSDKDHSTGKLIKEKGATSSKRTENAVKKKFPVSTIVDDDVLAPRFDQDSDEDMFGPPTKWDSSRGKKSPKRKKKKIKNKKLDSTELEKKENSKRMNNESTFQEDEPKLGVRNKTFSRDFKDELKDKERRERNVEMQKSYGQWNIGLKQIEDYKNKLQEEDREMSKPFARYSDDKDLDDALKNVERDGDPMLMYLRGKKFEEERKSKTITMPKYQGPFPENRFNIRPGYRWDGVDRSNGYEKNWFKVQSEKISRQEEAYMYSIEDM